MKSASRAKLAKRRAENRNKASQARKPLAYYMNPESLEAEPIYEAERLCALIELHGLTHEDRRHKLN